MPTERRRFGCVSFKKRNTPEISPKPNVPDFDMGKKSKPAQRKPTRAKTTGTAMVSFEPSRFTQSTFNSLNFPRRFRSLYDLAKQT